MSLHTSGHVVAPKSGLFACHHASSNADEGEPRKNDALKAIDDAREQTNYKPLAQRATAHTNARQKHILLAKLGQVKH